MKKSLWIVFLAVMLVAIGALPMAAVGPVGSYVTGIACANLESTDGTLSVTFYDQNGLYVATTGEQTIFANNVKIYYTPSLAYLSDGFSGSARIASNRNLSCSVNTQTNAGSGIARIGTSMAQRSTDLSTTTYVPQILYNAGGGFSSYIALRNPNVNANYVTTNYYNSAGTLVKTFGNTIPGYGSLVIHQDNGDLTAGFVGSAEIVSTYPLATMVSIFNTGQTPGTAQHLTYNGFSNSAYSIGSTIYGPRVVKNMSGVGFTSGITCQNVSAYPFDVTANFKMYDQTTHTWKDAQLIKTSLPPHTSWVLYMGNTLNNSTLDGITMGKGSVTIYAASNGQLACIFNEDSRTIYAGWGSTYNGIPSQSVATTILFPQILSLGSNSFQGGFDIKNTSVNATTCTYYFSNGDTITNQYLEARGSLMVYAPTTLINNVNTFNGSVRVTCGQNIVGTYNFGAKAQSGDTFATNVGTSQ